MFRPRCWAADRAAIADAVHRHIGIDYSGAQTAESRLEALQVYESRDGGKSERVSTPAEGAKNWTRLEVAQFCAAAIESGEPVIIGIDHAFSFPMSYMQRYGIKSWDQFLGDFMRHWPTADPNTYVISARHSACPSRANPASKAGFSEFADENSQHETAVQIRNTSENPTLSPN